MEIARTAHSRSRCSRYHPRHRIFARALCMEEEWKIGENIVVVGGGNVAFDVARTSVRNGAKKVTMVCLESRDEQTADEFEIEDGMEEGITIINRVGTDSCRTRCCRAKSPDCACSRSIPSLTTPARFAPQDDPRCPICHPLRYHCLGHRPGDGYEPFQWMGQKRSAGIRSRD